MESGFAPFATLVTIAAGMTGGDFLGYMLGMPPATSPGIAWGDVRVRLERLLGAVRSRHRMLPYGLLFLYAAFAPIPNELVVIPLAFMRYSLPGVMTTVLCGNVIFNSLVASGVTWVLGWWRDDRRGPDGQHGGGEVGGGGTVAASRGAGGFGR